MSYQPACLGVHFSGSLIRPESAGSMNFFTAAT